MGPRKGACGDFTKTTSLLFFFVSPRYHLSAFQSAFVCLLSSLFGTSSSVFLFTAFQLLLSSAFNEYKTFIDIKFTTQDQRHGLVRSGLRVFWTTFLAIRVSIGMVIPIKIPLAYK